MPGKHDPSRPRLGQRLPSGPRPLSSRAIGISQLTSAGPHLPDIAGGDVSYILDDQPNCTTSPEHTPPDSADALADSFARVLGPLEPEAQDEVSSIASKGGIDVNPYRVVVPALSPQLGETSASSDILTKGRPRPLRVNTANLLPPPSTSPKKAISPSLRHWQQIRSHVLTTPAEESGPAQSKATKGIVGKAAARLGLRHAADNVLESGDRRKSVLTGLSGLEGLSEVEKEEIGRERRRFARDVKNCLDACSAEDSRRRLRGVNQSGALGRGASAFETTFSPYAPLLTELHRYLPAARARKAWCRTCPHHATILAELSTAFLPGSTSSSGERQQVLEVFGVVVRTWAADSAEEELSRWLWLCCALRPGDRQLRNRGFPLLSSFLHRDPVLPAPLDFPTSASALQALSAALFELLYAIDQSSPGPSEHRQVVLDLLDDLSRGDIIAVDHTSLPTHAEHGGWSKTSRVEAELIWASLARLARSPSLVGWLFSHENPTLLRFAPPPILHATPPILLHLRATSAVVFLGGLATTISQLSPSVVQQVYGTIQDLIISTVDQLPTDGASLLSAASTFMTSCLLCECSRAAVGDTEDPFRDPTLPTSASRRYIDDIEVLYTSGEHWRGSSDHALTQAVQGAGHIHDALAMLEYLSSRSSLARLFASGVQALIKHIKAAEQRSAETTDFLRRLSRTHPQLYYKPLFSLAASASPETVAEHLRTVQAISEAVGGTSYWLEADPQMIVMTLTGPSKLMKSKGKGREGALDVAKIRIGRYAVMVEFLLFLGGEIGQKKAGSRLRGFIEAVEEGVSAMLDTQDVGMVLPVAYRALLCILYHRCRTITRSIKPAAWQRMVLGWFLDIGPTALVGPVPETLVTLDDLVNTYKTTTRVVTHIAPSASNNRPTDPMINDKKQQSPVFAITDPLYPLLRPDPQLAIVYLLVLLQSVWTLDDWGAILPRIWKLFDPDRLPPANALLFLIAKCGELVPAQLAALVGYELSHPEPHIRVRAIRKLATLYLFRHHVLDAETITKRKGPLFQFLPQTLDFVLTEIGSPTWSAPHDAKQEALQEYGSTLPLHVRQQLADLGWSDDVDLQVDDERASEPVTLLSSRHLLDTAEASASGRSGQLGRSGSLGASSDGSSQTKSRPNKAIFPPILWEVAAEQAGQVLGKDASAASLLLELIRLLQREEPMLFIRPFANRFSENFADSLSHLNAALISATPGFAHASLNALVGYLKHTRQSLSPGVHAAALATIASIISRVSEVSLRDIRKNKAESVLLPASIYEDEGVFKVFRPWLEGQLEVQAAQLHILAQLVKVNPRDIYLIKRMMANLPVQDYLHDVTFARTWLQLNITFFGTLKREYDDKVELRHSLSITATIFRLHASDLLVTTHSMHLFMLCSARFRRVFAIMGFQAVAPSIFNVYARANRAARDCNEYAMRSFYRIHEDTAVYHTCLAIAKTDRDDAGAAYDLLYSLTEDDSPHKGVASGIRGLNEQEELDALARMMSGPEIALSDIGKDRAERQAIKMAEAAYDSRRFSKEKIVKLFVTVIATDPPGPDAIRMLRLFAGIVPCITDEPSKKLLHDGIEALGDIISNERVERRSAHASEGDQPDTPPDWPAVKTEYLRLVEAWNLAGGLPSALLTKSACSMAATLVHDNYDPAYVSASALLRSLAVVHLSAGKPSLFLKQQASALFSAGLGKIDLAGFLAELAAWIRREDYDVEIGASRILTDSYLQPAIRFIASPTSCHTNQIPALRASVVGLLAATTFTASSALDILEEEEGSPGLFFHVILPLVTSLDVPTGAFHAERALATWIRLLHMIIQPRARTSTPSSDSDQAILEFLRLQAVKVIAFRARDAINAVDGLWGYLAHYIADTLCIRNRAYQQLGDTRNLTLLDLMTWSTYEQIILHRTPLSIHLRHKIQAAVADVDDDSTQPTASAADNAAGDLSPDPFVSPVNYPALRDFRPAGSTFTPPVSLRRPYISSLRSMPRTRDDRLSPAPEVIAHHQASNPQTSLDQRNLRHSLRLSMPRPHLSPQEATRLAFSHPTGKDAGQGMRYRFPSSVLPRSTGDKGAIVHLLSNANHVVSAGPVSDRPRNQDLGQSAERATAASTRLTSPILLERLARAQRTCQIIFGRQVDEGDVPIRPWSVQDVLRQITEDTRVVMELCFPDVHPATIVPTQVEGETIGYNIDRFQTLDVVKHEAESDPFIEP